MSRRVFGEISSKTNNTSVDQVTAGRERIRSMEEGRQKSGGRRKSSNENVSGSYRPANNLKLNGETKSLQNRRFSHNPKPNEDARASYFLRKVKEDTKKLNQKVRKDVKNMEKVKKVALRSRSLMC